MYYFIKAYKDAYITENSPGHVVQFENHKYKNYGGDEILELKKEFTNELSTSPFGVSRMLCDFDLKKDLTPNLEVSGGLIPTASANYYLRYFEVEGQSERNQTYVLEATRVHQLAGGWSSTTGWDEGVGKKFDNPKMRDGVTWVDHVSGSGWHKANSNLLSGSRSTPGGGVWLKPEAYVGNHASQSFLNESADINMNVTNLINQTRGDNRGGGGYLIKFSGSYENDGTPVDLKFFSRYTNTVYAPRLEVRWDDVNYPDAITSSLNYLTMSGELENDIFISGLKSKYRIGERVRFNLGCRKKYVQKTFTQSSLTSSFAVPNGSGSYSIIDSRTNETIVPFGDYTKLSVDGNGMYFNQWFDNWEPGRYFKIIFRLKYNDGTTQIIDNDEEFKVI